jgi:hypothetical protein
MDARTRVGTIAAVLTMLAMSAGCASTSTLGAQAAAGRDETRRLAPGVELRIAADASPGAREAAERLEVEYQSTYLNAYSSPR